MHFFFVSLKMDVIENAEIFSVLNNTNMSCIQKEHNKSKFLETIKKEKFSTNQKIKPMWAQNSMRIYTLDVCKEKKKRKRKIRIKSLYYLWLR